MKNDFLWVAGRGKKDAMEGLNRGNLAVSAMSGQSHAHLNLLHQRRRCPMILEEKEGRMFVDSLFNATIELSRPYHRIERIFQAKEFDNFRLDTDFQTKSFYPISFRIKRYSL